MTRLEVWLTTGYSIILREIQFKQVEVQFWDSNLEIHHYFVAPDHMQEGESLDEFWTRSRKDIKQAFRDYLKSLEEGWQEEKRKRDLWINSMFEFTSPYNHLWG